MPGGKRSFWGFAFGATLVLTAIALAGLYYLPSRRATNRLTRGVTAYELGQWGAAVEFARDALRKGRDDPLALRLLARSSARLGRDDAALAIYARRPVQDTIEAEDYLLIGRSLDRRGQSDAAARAWEKAVESEEAPPRALDELARLHLRAGRKEEAAPLAERLSRQKGWEAPGSLMLGSIRAMLNDIPGAAEAFQHALALDATSIDRSGDPTQLKKLIARTFLRVGQPAAARASLQSILTKGIDAEASWLASRADIQEGNLARAEQASGQSRSYRALHPLEAEPGPYVGEAACENCHREIFRDSLTSRHTQSFYRGAQLNGLPRPDRPLPDPDDPNVTHAFVVRDGALREETRVGDEVSSAVIAYAFGTSDRYLTMVSRDEYGQYHIARLSYYATPHGQGWDRSALDKIRRSGERSQEFHGGAVSARDGVAKCLYCHTTNARTGREPTGPETSDRAVGCERCHGPGGNHLKAVAGGLSDAAIANPARASPAIVTSQQCNDCHILGPYVRDKDKYGPEWVRSQGVGWTKSRCNTASDGAFGCVTCHDPHRGARALGTAGYDNKCLGCHARASRTAQQPDSHAVAGTGAGHSRRVCPVEPAKGCVSCHMPKVQVGVLHLDLTDHYIRVPRQSDRAAP
jgi:tetratricopeptide (TPR) repeat protein